MFVEIIKRLIMELRQERYGNGFINMSPRPAVRDPVRREWGFPFFKNQIYKHVVPNGTPPMLHGIPVLAPSGAA